MMSEKPRPPPRGVCGLYSRRQPVASVLATGGIHAQAAVLAQQDESGLLFAAAAAPVADSYHVGDLGFGGYHLQIVQV